MFSDFYEKINFKKTTPEEKKDVVENTGEWFPEEHENKIKGLDKAEEKVMKYKNCKECGKIFAPYNNIQKYCSDECAKNGANRLQRENYAKNKKSASVTSKRKRMGRTPSFLEAEFNEAKRLRKQGMYAKEIAERLGFNEKIIYQAVNCVTYEGFCNKYRKNTSKDNFALNRKRLFEGEMSVVEEPEEVDYLKIMETAVKIVRALKDETNVKASVDIVYNILSKGD